MGDTHSNSKFSNNKICIIQEVSNPSHSSSNSKWEAGTSILRQRNNTGLIIGPVGDIQISNRVAANIHNKI